MKWESLLGWLYNNEFLKLLQVKKHLKFQEINYITRSSIVSSGKSSTLT